MNNEWSFKEQIFSDFVNICDDSTRLSWIKTSPFNLKYIQNPSEKIQIAAVKDNWDTIVYIKNPTEKVQLIALKKNIYTIRYIKKLTIKNQLFLIESLATDEYKDIITECLEILIKDGKLLKKITEAKLLHQLYNLISDIKYRKKIQKSKYWKDDAKLILEVINEE